MLTSRFKMDKCLPIRRLEQVCHICKTSIPEIILSNLKENTSITPPNTTFALNTNIKNKSPRENKLTHKKGHRKNGRCNYCNRKGHYFYECKLRKNSKRFRKSNFRKNNRKFNKSKHNKNYLNLSEKRDNYNSTFSDIFTSDYNSDSKNEIHYY